LLKNRKEKSKKDFFLEKIEKKFLRKKSQETAPLEKLSQRIQAHDPVRNWAQSRLPFLSRSFYLPRCYCNRDFTVKSSINHDDYFVTNLQT
jgi:hypothetical protein